MQLDTIMSYTPYLPYLIIFLLLGIIIYSENKSPSTFLIRDYFTSSDGLASTSKTLQMIAGISATIIVIQSSLQNHLTEGIFGIYLAAMGISEGWSRYITSKVSNG